MSYSENRVVIIRVLEIRVVGIYFVFNVNLLFYLNGFYLEVCILFFFRYFDLLNVNGGLCIMILLL